MSLRSLAPPDALLARVRWFFLVFWLLFWVALATHVIVVRSGGVAGAGLGAMVAIAVWWLRCYRCERFPLAALVFEIPLLVVTGLAMPDPLELVYSVIPFRAVFSRRPSEVVVTSSTVVAVTVGVASFTPGSIDMTPITSQLNSIVGTVGFALILYLATQALARAERSAARERVVAAAALALGEATDRDAVRRIVTSSAAAVLHDANTVDAIEFAVVIEDSIESNGETGDHQPNSGEENGDEAGEGTVVTSSFPMGNGERLLVHGATQPCTTNIGTP